MSLYDEIKYRGIKVVFIEAALTNLSTYEDIEVIKFITDQQRDVEKTMGYNTKTTLFVVIESYHMRKYKVDIVRNFLESKNVDIKFSAPSMLIKIL